MSLASRHVRRAPALTVAAATLALVAAGLSGGSATAGGAAPPSDTPASDATASSARAGGTSGSGEIAPNYDSRTASSDALVRSGTRAIEKNGRSLNRLDRSIGGDAEVSVDAVTGTPSEVSSRLGFLTTASSRPAAAIALGFVRSHLDAFGLSAADLNTLVKARQVTDINGITHVYWIQKAQGIAVFGNGLRAHVDRAGHLLSVQGSPVAGLAKLAARAPAARLSADAATSAAVRDTQRGATTSAGREASADQVWFLTPTGLRPGWSTYTEPTTQEAYQHVVDGVSGHTLYRHSTINFDRDPQGGSTAKRKARHGDALVFDNYPGARGNQTGGKQRVVNFVDAGWLSRKATLLHGKYAYVFADVNDDNIPQAREQDPAPFRNRPQFAFKPYGTTSGQETCSKSFQCTWDPSKPFSWGPNKKQDGVQAFFYTSRYAKWLSKAPFGFTSELGNFEKADGDEVLVNTLDGANTDGGLPDGAHTNNANFNTPPDGRRPTMQMYLNQAPGYLAASSSNPFDNIGHEFTHGLSNRLVVDSSGSSTLNSYQAGGMGEAWGDFYSFDFLLTKGYIKKDTAAAGELMYDHYLTRNRAYTRTEAIDCPVGKDAKLCKQVDGVGVGGYTYGDIPRMLTTEVHSAGEVWAQTMWDLHRALGHEATMRLVTSAMTLAPNDPSMLDMRDAMILADKAIYSRKHTDEMWKTFAHRGFGYFAASIDGSDAEPVEDFTTPPDPTLAPGTITGTVSTPTGDPVPAAFVTVAGHGSGIAGSYSAITRADGTYTISGVVPGTYPKVAATAAGYESDFSEVAVVSDEEASADFTIRRDFAAIGGGGSIESFTGVDYSDFGCGPRGAIDLSKGTGWGSATTPTEDPVSSQAEIVPESIVIKLPEAVDVQAFGVDPTSTCGDAGSSSTADYTIEVGTSATGPWTPAASGTFTADDRGTTVEIPAAATLPGVTYVRYTMESTQVPDFAGCPDDYDGCSYMDTTEVAVYDDIAGP